jgi:hypothetical protein
MSIIPFPNESHKRRTILILSRYEYERLNYESWGNPLLRDAMNGKVFILISSEINEENLIIQNIIQKGIETEGNLLIQNPYDQSDYEIVDNALSNFTLAKWSHFVTFCDYLGVKNLTIEQAEVSSLSGKELYKGEIDTPVGNVNLDWKQTIDKLRQSSLRIKRNILNSERDSNVAEQYLRKYFSNDQFIKSLIDLQPKGSYELEFNLTQEVKRNIDIATGLNLPQIPGNTLYGNLKVKLDKVTRESYQYKLSIKVEF